MKVFCTGDWHITAHVPKKRLDNYVETQFNKVKQILEHASQYEDSAIVQPGDFFDTPTEPYWIINKYQELLSQYPNVKIFITYGQHDLRYHTHNFQNTPLYTFEANRSVTHPVSPIVMDNVVFHAAPWNSEIEPPDRSNYPEGSVHVLMLHKMIIDEKLWDDQEHFTWGTDMISKYGYDLTVCGDNHKYFLLERDGKLLTNCGSIMRSNVGQKDHKPAYVVFDSHTREHEVHYLKVPEFSEVFDTTNQAVTKDTSKKLLDFVDSLNEGTGVRDFDFLRNLLDFAHSPDNSYSDSLKKVIEEIVDECHE